MKPNPSIAELKAMGVPWDIDEVMAGALKINVTFKIECEYDSIKETRVIPSIIYLGHDMECLYIGGKFIGMFTNPASKPDEMHPNFLDVFFDVANDGKLTFPEAGSRLSITVYNHKWKTSGWFHDLVWVEKEDLGRKWIGWLFAENYYFPKGVPGFAVKNAWAEYDNKTGTVTMIFARLLRQPKTLDTNALQMKPGERWVMGFMLELGYATSINDESGKYPTKDFVDGWPKKAYPYLSNDSSWWPKIVIDLTNPPLDLVQATEQEPKY